MSELNEDDKVHIVAQAVTNDMLRGFFGSRPQSVHDLRALASELVARVHPSMQSAVQARVDATIKHWEAGR